MWNQLKRWFGGTSNETEPNQGLFSMFDEDQTLARSSQSPDVYLAHFNRTDGLGAVVHSKLMARALANYFELTYVDMSLEQIANEPPDHTKEEHAKAAERFFGLGEGQPTFDAIRKTARIHYTDTLTNLSRRPGTLNVLGNTNRNWRKRFLGRRGRWGRISPLSTRQLELQMEDIATELESPADVFAPIQEAVRAVYDRGPSADLKTDYAADRLDIAVHIRRGDVVAKRLWPRFTPNAYYLAIIGQLKAILPDKPLRIHVFSQSEPKPSLLDEDFAPFEDLGCCMHLDGDLFESLHHLVAADILVTSKSSFSYLPAVLSRGAVVYEPFWHRPMSPWIVCDSNGGFDGERLRTTLQGKRLL